MAQRGPARQTAGRAATQTDRDASLSDGVVVQARLVARLLGRIRLLTVEGTVLLSPARIDALTALAAPPRHNGTRLAPAATASPPVGARLAEVARDLDVNLRRLEAAERADGSGP